MKKFFTLLVVALVSLGISAQKSIDDITGSYSSKGTYGVSNASNGSVSSSFSWSGVQIYKIDSENVKITQLGRNTVVVKGKFDASAQTITVDTTYSNSRGYSKAFQFTGSTITTPIKDRTPAVFKVNSDGTISLNYAIDYGDGTAAAFKETLTLTSSKGKLLWSAEGTLNYLKSDGTVWEDHSYICTISKFDGGDYDYEMTYAAPGYTSNPTTIQFGVDKEGIYFNNGTDKEDYTIFRNPFYGCLSLCIDPYEVAFEGTPTEAAGKINFPYEAKGNSGTLCKGVMTFEWPYVEPTNASDVNGDGNVDSQDVLKIYDFMKSSSSDKSGDVNSDGKIDSQDVLKVYDYMKNN